MTSLALGLARTAAVGTRGLTPASAVTLYAAVLASATLASTALLTTHSNAPVAALSDLAGAE